MRFQHAVRPIICALGLALALPAAAVAGWSTPESVSTGAPSPLVLAANGTGLVFRYSATSQPTVAERPPGGPLGAADVLTGNIGKTAYPVMAVDSSGNALIADRSAQQVAYRPAGGPVGPAQNLGALKYPALLSMAPTGEAMVGLNPSPNGSVEVAFRAAGPLSTFDIGSAESFAANSDHGVIVGLQLQADGGAIVLWLQGDTLYQSVRPAGAASFNAPTQIAIPAGADTRKFGVRFDSDPSGWAMVAWQASSTPGGSYDEAMASVRAPGGSFPAAQVVGLDNNQMANATPAVTASGDGVVTWQHTDSGTPPSGCYSPGSVMAAMQHQGTWSAPAALTPGAFPDVSISGFPNTATSAGNDIVIPFVAIHKDPCSSSTETRSLNFRHFRSGASGLTDQGTTQLLAPFAGFPLISDMAMEPGGRILVSYNKSGGFLSDFDGVTPGTGSTPTPTPTPTPGAGPPGSGTPPGSGPTTPPKIAAIIPRHFVTIAPIDPAALELQMVCPPDETCVARGWAYYRLTGKPPPWAHQGHATKTRRILLATGTKSLPAGAKGKLKLKPTRLGRKALRRGLKLKIELKLTLTTATKHGTSSYQTTIKARKKKHR